MKTTDNGQRRRMTMATPSPTAETAPILSAYERTRAENIKRNNARLRALGLISTQEELESNNEAYKIAPPAAALHQQSDQEEASSSDEEEYIEDGESSPRKKSRKRKKNTLQPSTSPSRKSSRLQGIEPDGVSITVSLPSTKEDRVARVKECREVRQRAALRMAELGAEKAAQENPTATYEHCLMRVRTMAPKALARRVQAIERAVGKHCVVKMAIFKSCLQDEEMWELAETAGESLERLKALLPPPV